MGVVLALTGASSSHAAPGDLDPEFSTDGKVALPSAGGFVPRAVALQGDGRIVVAGWSCGDGQGTCQDGSSFRVARFTSDGGLDAEFGDNGIVTTPFGSGRSQAFDVLVVPGGLVAGGVASDSEGRDVFALVGYDDRGAVVWSELQRIGAGFAAIADLAHGPDGTILAAGQADQRMVVARFTPAGELDPSFGTGGWTEGEPGYAMGVAVGPTGAMIAAGLAGATDEPATQLFGAMRLTGGGFPDAGFGANGFATQAVGVAGSFANAVATTVDGGWITAGSALLADGRQAMGLVRGTTSGATPVLWTTTVSEQQGAYASDVIALPDGRFIAAGQLALDAGGSAFATARLGPDGALDPAYGAGGLAAAGWGQYPFARATAATAQADGRVVTAGLGCSGGTGGPSCTDGTAVLLLARQLGDPASVPVPPPPPPPAPTPPARDLTPPTARLSGLPERVRRNRLRRRGVQLRVRASEPVRIEVRLTGRRRSGKPLTLSRRRPAGAQRSVRVRLRPGKAAVRRVRRGTLRVRIRLVDLAGNATTLRSRVLLR